MVMIMKTYLLQVSEVQATSALLKWGPPVREDAKFDGLDHITDKSFRYEVGTKIETGLHLVLYNIIYQSHIWIDMKR